MPTVKQIEAAARAIYEKFEDLPEYAKTQMCGPLSEELALAALTAAEAQGVKPDPSWLLSMSGSDVMISFDDREDAERAFEGLEDCQIISALINPENGA